MGKLLRILAILFFLFFDLSNSVAQQTEQKDESPTSRITGTLVDKIDGKPVPDIWLILLSYNGMDKKGSPKVIPIIVNGSFATAKTSPYGTFTFTEIPAGIYVIKVGADQQNFTGGYVRMQKDNGTGTELGIINLSPAVEVDIGKILLENK